MQLTADAIDHILSFLTPQEVLCNFVPTSRHLRAVEAGTLGHVGQWNRDMAALEYLRRVSEGAAVDEPRASFFAFARNAGMLHCGYLHGRVTRALAAHDAFLAQEPFREVRSGLDPGMPAEEIERLWKGSSWSRSLGPRCPAGLKAVYTVVRPCAKGRVLGLYRVYDIAAHRTLLPFEELVTFAQPAGPVPLVLPVIVEGNMSQHGVALIGPRVEAVDEVAAAAATHRLTAQAVAHRALRGPGLHYECSLPPNGGGSSGDAAADVLLEWLEGVAAGNHAVMRDPMVEEPFLDIFPSARYDPCVAEQTTEGVTVRTSALVLHSVSSPHRVLCSYQVRICMGARVQARRRLRLSSRSWEVLRDGSVVDTVEGSGVIGLYPCVAPTAAAVVPVDEDGLPSASQVHFDDDDMAADQGWFVYASLTTVDRPSEQTISSMAGYFTFEDQGDPSRSTTVDVRVPRTDFRVRPVAPEGTTV